MNNPTPLVSVVMPTYNAERFLSQAVNSILAQTYTNFELILVDDGSTDQTPVLLHDYRIREPRVVLHTFEKNSGIAAALNQGLSLAQGKYYARMDADDISLPGRLEQQVAYLETHPAVGVLGCGATVIDAAGRQHQRLVFPSSHRLLCWSLCFYSPLIHPAVMIRGELLRSAGGYLATAAHAEDYELWARLSALTQLANLPNRLLLLRKSGENVSTQQSADFLKAGITVSQGMFRSLIGQDLPITPFELTLRPRRISPVDLRKIMIALMSLLDLFLSQPEATGTEKQYLRRETALRLFRLITSSSSSRQTFELLSLALKCDPFLFIHFPRLALHKLISR
jgi:glycosyltransferase involved in cell wall biosynthesis